MDQIIAPGRYKYYKGTEYTVTGEIKDFYSNCVCIMFKNFYGDMYYLPECDWIEPVTLADGTQIERFTRIGD